MRKLKLLLPIMAATGTCAVAAPVITSCSKIDQTVKNECLGMIERSYAMAIGRNPESKDICLKYKKNAFGYIDEAQSTNQILSIAYMYCPRNAGDADGIIESIAREPESNSAIKQLEAYSIKKILSVTDERVIAVGKAAGGLAEVAARNPESFDMLFKDFKNFVEKTLGL